MKSKRTPWYSAPLIALSFAALAHTPYTGQVVVDHQPTATPVHSSGPLLVDNQWLNPALLSTVSRGSLTVVSTDPANETRERIPFRVYLKRDGDIVENGVHRADQPVTEIDLKDVLVVARPGDWLVIEPIRTDNRVPRHTLLVKSPVNLWIVSLGRDNC
jgi:hypothetical protein